MSRENERLMKGVDREIEVDVFEVVKLFAVVAPGAKNTPAKVCIGTVDFIFFVDVKAIFENQIIIFKIYFYARCNKAVDFSFYFNLVVIQHFYKNEICYLLYINPRVCHLV